MPINKCWCMTRRWVFVGWQEARQVKAYVKKLRVFLGEMRTRLVSSDRGQRGLTKIMDKGTIKWLLLAAIAVCGMLGYKVATHASKGGRKEVVLERPEPRFGVVTAILFCEEDPTILIEDQVLHEGDVIHEVKVLEIGADRVQFDKQGERWEQGVQEPAKPEWWKRKGKEDDA
jgi:hypothetical protein